MHVGRKRIFVGNLPPHVQENEIRDQFGPYGTIVSVEIKHRKDSANEETSPVFAFVSIETDDNSLHTCFQEISNYDWQGYYVKLQLAKESFLERLKREREEVQGKTSSTPPTPKPVEISAPVAPKRVIVSSESDSSSEEEIPVKTKTKQSVGQSPDVPEAKINESDDDIKLIIKNNKNKFALNGKLKIESVSATPVYIIAPRTETAQPKDAKSLAADEKRRKSLTQMKNSYNQQKSAIQNALASIDLQPKNKITFEGQSKKRKNSNVSNDNLKKNKFDLFENDGDNNEDYNFDVKKQFEGKQGQKLLELQSRYTNDKRFTLDSRFYEEDPDQEYPEEQDEERDQQFGILESVLGKKLKKFPKNERDRYIPQPMLRFDPSNPEHTKFELKHPAKPNLDMEEEFHQELRPKVIEAPAKVSKETFYKVTDNLKESLQENTGFSLLNMFGRAEAKDKEIDYQQSEALKPQRLDHGRNPFKYDSSDEEDNAEDPKTREIAKKPVVRRSWREAFFFAGQDERLQNGLDFVKKLGEETKESFPETRRELKQIIRSKVRNNQRNNRPFRKKLGRSKMIKVKKAKKR